MLYMWKERVGKIRWFEVIENDMKLTVIYDEDALDKGKWSYVADPK